jgi:hypothetical protein
MSVEDDVMEEVPAARGAYRRGVSPSKIVADLVERRQWNGITLVLFGMRAFRLTIPECKMAEGWSERGLDAAVFDAYFRPLIEAHRPQWDV